jgi:hypothetical protein
MTNNNTAPVSIAYTEVSKPDTFNGFVGISPNICYIISRNVTGYYLTYRGHVNFNEDDNSWKGGQNFLTLEKCKEEAEKIQALNPVDASIAFRYLKVPLQQENCLRGN